MQCNLKYQKLYGPLAGTKLVPELQPHVPNWFRFNYSHFPSQLYRLRTINLKVGLVKNVR